MGPVKQEIPKELLLQNLQPKITDQFKIKKVKTETKVKRKINRFNGMSEEEVAKKTLPDYLKPGLDIVFIGINPSMTSAYTGRYYSGPGNHFWKALYLSGLVSGTYFHIFKKMLKQKRHKGFFFNLNSILNIGFFIFQNQ